jgi:phosphonate transport system ATP-binding protein
MLNIANLSKSYGSNHAVKNVSLSVSSGSFVGVIGRSGAGKSTLLRMINRLEEPSSGSICFGDLDITRLEGRELRQWRRACAMVFQQFNLVGRMDVLTNVLMGRLTSVPNWRSLLQLWSDEDRVRALAVLERFDMGEFAAQRCDQLSGGQQQRVAICRALVQEPRIILADEPIASLDPRNTKTVMDSLRAINRDLGITVICNLHSLDIARDYCTRLIGLTDGEVVFDGPPDALTDALVTRLYGLGAQQIDSGHAYANDLSGEKKAVQAFA